MKLNSGYEKDPLRSKSYNVLVEGNPGEFHIVGKTSEDIALLKMDVERQHVQGMCKENMAIVEEGGGDAVASFQSFFPPHIAAREPNDPERLEFRDRWIAKMMEFILPRELFARRTDEDAQEEIRAWLKEAGIEISIAPDNSAVRFYRSGVILSEWGA